MLAAILPTIDSTKPSIAYQTRAGEDALPAKRAMNAIPPTIELFETHLLEFGSFFIKPKLARNKPTAHSTPTPTNTGRKNDPAPLNRVLLGLHPACRPIKREYARYRYANDPRNARIKPRAPLPDCFTLFADFAIFFTFNK